MRLDVYLTAHFNIQSRNKATELIKSNKVKCDGVIIAKPSFNVENHHTIELLEEDFYVSRAAYKLKYFLDELHLEFKNKEALDIGSSTGGFTQILLEKDIHKVTCVDVGSNQLHPLLKNHPKIEFFEQCDIRNFKPNKTFDIVTCDVSFISLHNILNAIHELSSSEIILLFKPQFEVGNTVRRDKKGVVQDQKAIEVARLRFIQATQKLQWECLKSSPSQVQGKDGNLEELFYFKKNVRTNND